MRSKIDLRTLVCLSAVLVPLASACAEDSGTGFPDTDGGTGGKVIGKGGSGGTTPAGGSGGTTPAGGSGGTTPAGGSGGTTPAGGSGGITPTGGSGGTTPADGSGGTLPAGGSGGGGTDCGMKSSVPACNDCLISSCCAQAQACAASADCVAVLQCVQGCTDQTCANNCGAAHPAGVTPFNNVFGCLDTSCATACGGGSGGSGGGGTGGSPSNDAAQICVDTINQYRATLNLPPYTRWADGESCASGEAKSDSQTGQAHGAFGSCGESAQNECPGWPPPDGTMIPQCLQMMWAEGPGDFNGGHGHYINMSSTNYSQVACGFYDSPNGVWSVQNFR